MSDLVLEAVSVSYGDRRAVIDVDLVVPSGQVVAVLGPSGCGKSTLLRAVAGLEPLQSGAVMIDGADQAGVPTHRRGVGLMFQDHALFTHLNVGENVEFGLRMQRLPADRRQARVTEMLRLVDLADRVHDPVTELSGGEQQRVALARTLAPEPRVVLLDEPLGALDRALRRDLLGVLEAAFTATRATAVYVTHDHDEAFTLAPEVALMRQGRVVQQGTPRQLRASPVDPWVTNFLADDPR